MFHVKRRSTGSVQARVDALGGREATVDRPVDNHVENVGDNSVDSQWIRIDRPRPPAGPGIQWRGLLIVWDSICRERERSVRLARSILSSEPNLH